MDHGATPESDPWNFFGFEVSGQATEEFHKNGLLDPDRSVLVVELNGQLIGAVSWRAMSYGPPPTGRPLNIGCTLLPQFRGLGHGTEAQRLLADYLLDVFPIHRVEATTDADNRAEQRSLEKAGFTREGVLRGFAWRAGAWRDMVCYSRVRGDA